VASSLYYGLSFRSLLSLGGGTGNAPWISLRPSLITEHHFVSTLNDLAPNLTPRSAQLGLGMANEQPRALACECWFRCAPSAESCIRKAVAERGSTPAPVGFADTTADDEAATGTAFALK
jgi:hypothetical protein